MIHDITVTIHENMIVYKNRDKKQPKFSQSATFADNGVYETDIKMNLHTGSHIDFPLHTIEDGGTSKDHSLEPLIGPSTVYDLTHLEDKIDLKTVQSLNIKANDFVLFKTKNSFDATFNYDFIYLDHEAAIYLKEKGVRGVGIDALGIERAQPGHPTHDTLLGANIIILEGIDLSEISPGAYELWCVPMKIDNVEALPVRALLKTL